MEKIDPKSSIYLLSQKYTFLTTLLKLEIHKMWITFVQNKRDLTIYITKERK